jgi:LytS/YehU family sensor histidine kinase
MQPAVVFFEYLIWGFIIVFIYVNRRTALQASSRMNRAQVEQARARRRTLESRLQALQARVEPQFLFNTLARVRALYAEDAARGGRLLEDLIVYLRAALPHLRDSMSTLGKEIDLVGAYLGIMRAHLGDRLPFDGDLPLPAATRDMVFPPMILLPLVDHVLVLSGSADYSRLPSVRIDALAESKRLRVEVSAPVRDRGVACDRGALIDLRNRLNALYGDRATLVVESSGTSGTRVTMEIPHEGADSDPR